MSDYWLNRDSSESKRLVEQHELWTKNLGYLIHPTIATNLPKDATIADIGTGTGVWSLAVSKAFPNFNIVGFDISPAQFPPKHVLPSNVSLQLHDLRNPFPPEMHESFDVVNLRLLVLAMADQDAWTSAVQNLRTILKPGGWIQWVDGDFESVSNVVRTGDANTHSVEALKKGLGWFLSLTKPRLQDVREKLLYAFWDAKLKDVEVDTVASDRLPEMRNLATKMEIGAAGGVIKMKRAQQAAGVEVGPMPPGTVDDDANLVLEMYKEAEQGAYITFFILCVFGRKPYENSRGDL